LDFSSPFIRLLHHACCLLHPLQADASTKLATLAFLSLFLRPTVFHFCPISRPPAHPQDRLQLTCVFSPASGLLPLPCVFPHDRSPHPPPMFVLCRSTLTYQNPYLLTHSSRLQLHQITPSLPRVLHPFTESNPQSSSQFC